MRNVKPRDARETAHEVRSASLTVGTSGKSDERVAPSFVERLAGWQLKALREAKLATDWTTPNETYEAAARNLFAGEPIDLLTDIAVKVSVAGC